MENEELRDLLLRKHNRVVQQLATTIPVVFEDVQLTEEENKKLFSELNQVAEPQQESLESLLGRIKMPESMYDIIDLNELIVTSEEKELITLASGVSQKMLEAKKKEEEDKAYLNYTRVFDEAISQLEQALQYYYPDNWEISAPQGKNKHKSIISTELKRCHGNVNRYMSEYSELEGMIARVILIHIPEISVRNGRRQVHTMKEIYIKMNIGYNLRMISRFLMFRNRKTSREYAAQYNFSHTVKGNNAFYGCCLGQTALDTLVTELQTTQFDILKYELLLQQIPDYFSWESHEGGPYIKLEELFKSSMGSSQAPFINTGLYREVRDSLIKSRYQVKLLASSGSGSYGVDCKVNTDYDLWRKISEFTPRNLRFPYTDGTFISIYPQIDNMTRTNKQIQEINSSMPSTGVTYKGTQLRLQVDLNEDEEKTETTVELLADARILNYVVNEMSTRISKHIQDAYWNGIKYNEQHSDNSNQGSITKNGANLTWQTNIIPQTAS